MLLAGGDSFRFAGRSSNTAAYTANERLYLFKYNDIRFGTYRDRWRSVIEKARRRFDQYFRTRCGVRGEVETMTAVSPP
jgi:hypothetical protein